MSKISSVKKFLIVAGYGLLTSTSLTNLSYAEESKNRAKVLERVTVIGTQDRRQEIPGSASIVDRETFDRYQYTDVNRALREVPGVVIQEEDGYGLRPNISIRGGRSNRSADITLMEDSILTGPAPYAAPEAYYFPQMDRMESLEVIKGTGSIKYGPRTTNGVLNMITKPIPSSKQADFMAEYGSYGSFRTGVTTGTTVDNYGVMLNAFHKQTDGFKDIDFIGGDTGYNVEDYLGKFRVTTKPGAEYYQEVEMKFGYYDEISDETYLGLTNSDFYTSPHRRYAASQLDQMDANAWQSAATHFIELTPDLDLTTTLYHNTVDRTWYRLNGVSLGGTRRDIGVIFSNQAANAAYIDALRDEDGNGATFHQRSNAREYFSQGIQSTLAAKYGLGETKNKIEIGTRIHRDEEDRFQNEDMFNLQNGSAVVTSSTIPGSAGNRIQSANSWSGFVQNEMQWRGFTFTPGVRFEKINLKREEFASTDSNRTGNGLAVFENDLLVWIPGAGLSYDIDKNIKLLAGVHKGFAPPGVPGNSNEAAFSREEESINYEIGSRYNSGPFAAEAFAFMTKYDNLLGRDTFSSGGTGTGDVFNGGKVDLHGLELAGSYDAGSFFGLKKGYSLPIRANYTYTKSEFKNSFNSSFEEWGNVISGDELPYLPNNQFYISGGVETPDWGASIGGKYVGEARSKAGNGAIPEAQLVEAHWVFDAAGEYKITKNIRGFATVDNIFDEEYIAALRPAGARPGMPLTAMAGIKVSLW